MIDYYEFLQISPHADAETVHRVYRYLATRLHPDNPDSGDPEMFRLLKSAYDTLASPTRRAEYDAVCRREATETNPLSSSIDFMDSVEGELNRRVAVLAVLYFKRRSNPRFPEVSLTELEQRMGFPRDYLDFTTWYLAKKGYITRADNSDFSLTAEGVDYIEMQRTNLPVLNKLLTDGSVQIGKTVTLRKETENGLNAKGSKAPNGSGSIILPASMSIRLDRRQSAEDRRRKVVEGMTEIERRTGTQDRRVNISDRRQNKGDRRSYELINLRDDPSSTRVQ